MLENYCLLVENVISKLERKKKKNKIEASLSLESMSKRSIILYFHMKK